MLLSEFEYDRASEVYMPPVKEKTAIKSFGYSDGAGTEEFILRSLQKTKDITCDSERLFKFIKDWPSYYHLGPGRANIFRVLDLPHDSKVLELGCGCGAVTRYLGEQFKSIDALEGSFLRARIARERCRDLKNVRLFCSNIYKTAFQPDYDIVTLIGVLEYAPVFFDKSPEDACWSMLSGARSALKKNGILVIAIENKIGLKYWTGSPEEHTGKLYNGIHGYPRAKTPVTFSKTELRQYLNTLGLRHIHFYSCFPDYKFASTVFSDIGQERELYLHNWVDVPFKNYGSPRKYNIHEGLALRTLSQAGLLREFANSFLVAASEDDSCSVIKPDWSAKKISGFPRRKWYQCITTLRTSPEYYIEKQKMYSNKVGGSVPSEGIFVEQELCDSPWFPGDLLLFDVYESFFHSSFKGRMKELLTVYYEQLMERFSVGKTDNDGYPLVNGDAIDFIFRNIVKQDKNWVYIDVEWRSKEDIPIDYILYRCIINDIIPTRYPGAKNDIGNCERFMLESVKHLFPRYNRERLCKSRAMDERFIASVLIEFNPESIFEQRSMLAEQDTDELEAIRNSDGWKFLMRYYKFGDKIFPPNTKRRTCAKSLLRMAIRMVKSLQGG